MSNPTTFPASSTKTNTGNEKVNGVHHHREAATHHEAAAKQHLQAAKHHEDGNTEKAFESTLKAGGHHSMAKDSHREILKQMALKS